ncbi:MAG: hypothetical protein LBS79_12275 [Tannerella sp.]|nr:hypothetical protein [Tannerella sp.]
MEYLVKFNKRMISAYHLSIVNFKKKDSGAKLIRVVHGTTITLPVKYFFWGAKKNNFSSSPFFG